VKKQPRLTPDGQAIPPLLLTTGQAAKVLNISRSKLYSMLASGAIGPMPVDLSGCRRWVLSELESWILNGCRSREFWLSCKGIR